MDPRDDCPTALSINFGAVTLEYLKSGTISRYSCLEGYDVFGNSTVACDLATGTWPVQDLPMCSK